MIEHTDIVTKPVLQEPFLPTQRTPGHIVVQMHALIGAIRATEFQVFQTIPHVCCRNNHQMQLEFDTFIACKMCQDSCHLPTCRQSANRNTMRIDVQRFGVCYHPFHCIPAVIDAGREWVLGRHSIVYIDDCDVRFVDHVATPSGFRVEASKHPASLKIQ